MKYVIVSDSASNVFDISNTNYAYVPLKIVCGEKEYIDTPDLDVSAMIDDLRTSKKHSGTSCPNIYEWQQAFSNADCVFAITITGTLSGSYSAAMQAKEDYISTHKNAKVHVIDSLSAGPEMRIIIEKLSELISQELSFEAIVEAIEEYRKHTHLLFCLESLTNLANNGRVSPAKAKIAGVLGIRVVGRASDEGTLEQLHKVRGAEKSIGTIYKEMDLSGFKGGKVRIAQCQNPEAAEKLKDIILSYWDECDVEIEACTALCSYYAERGGLMIGYESI